MCTVLRSLGWHVFFPAVPMSKKVCVIITFIFNSYLLSLLCIRCSQMEHVLLIYSIIY